MALQGLEALPVLKAHDVVGRDRLLDRNGRLDGFRRSLHDARRHPDQGVMDVADQCGKVADRDRIVTHVSRYDVCGEFDITLAVQILTHRNDSPLLSTTTNAIALTFHLQ